MSPPTFRLTPSAERDLGQIWQYIAQDSEQAANRVLSAIEKALWRIVETPGIGHLREDLSSCRSRFVLVHSYLIVYRLETTPLLILRVLHAARDVQSLLDCPPDEV